MGPSAAYHSSTTMSTNIEALLHWLTVDRLLFLFWLVMSIAIVADGLVALYLDSPQVPQFLRTLLMFGKFGKEPKLTKLSSRNAKKTSNMWTLTSDWINSMLKKLEVPKSWFRHFYLYLLIVWFLVVYTISVNNFRFFHNFSTSHLLLVTQLIQSCRRIYETYFVSIYSDNSINVLHYLTGYLFYSTLEYATYDCIKDSFSRFESPSFGCWWYFALFLIASYIQYQSHVTLAQLRIVKSAKSTKSKFNHGYHIPQNGLFRWIACPHYLAEILIYLAMYQLVPSSNTSNLWPILLAFVTTNQVIAALVTHRWYQAKFGAVYPAKIKAIIPFVL